MKGGKLFATLLGGTGAFIFSNAVYKYFVLEKKDYPFRKALATSGAMLILAYILYQIEGEPKGEQEEEYEGIIINPEEVKATCHCEPICRIACFAKGAIGALSEEQIKKYCLHKYEEIRKKTKLPEKVS
jgi:hypothetical protein